MHAKAGPADHGTVPRLFSCQGPRFTLYKHWLLYTEHCIIPLYHRTNAPLLNTICVTTCLNVPIFCCLVLSSRKTGEAWLQPLHHSLAPLVDNVFSISGSGSGQRRSAQAEEVCEGHPTVGDKWVKACLTTSGQQVLCFTKPQIFVWHFRLFNSKNQLISCPRNSCQTSVQDSTGPHLFTKCSIHSLQLAFFRPCKPGDRTVESPG